MSFIKTFEMSELIILEEDLAHLGLRLSRLALLYQAAVFDG